MKKRKSRDEKDREGGTKRHLSSWNRKKVGRLLFLEVVHDCLFLLKEEAEDGGKGMTLHELRWC